MIIHNLIYKMNTLLQVTSTTYFFTWKNTELLRTSERATVGSGELHLIMTFSFGQSLGKTVVTGPSLRIGGWRSNCKIISFSIVNIQVYAMCCAVRRHFSGIAEWIFNTLIWESQHFQIDETHQPFPQDYLYALREAHLGKTDISHPIIHRFCVLGRLYESTAIN